MSSSAVPADRYAGATSSGKPTGKISRDDIEHKFREVARSCLSPRHIDRTVALAREMQAQANLDELVSIVAAPTHR